MERAPTLTLTDATVTKMLLTSEDYDDGNIADPTTNDRFNIWRANKYDLGVGGRMENAAPGSGGPSVAAGQEWLDHAAGQERVRAGRWLLSNSSRVDYAQARCRRLRELKWMADYGSSGALQDTATAAGSRPYAFLAERLQ